MNMKKICDKINKQQWRLTVPINSTMFRRSPSKEETSDKESKRSSGFYDFQEAQQEFDKTRSLPNSVYEDSSGSSTEEEEIFEDAKAMSDKNVKAEQSKEKESDMELYADVLNEIKSKNIDTLNSKFEYDVPRISFKFFDRETNREEEAEKDKDDESIYENEFRRNADENRVKRTIKSEVKIVLKSPPTEEESLSEEECEKEPAKKYVAQTEILVRKSYEDLPIAIVKSGSDPNLALRCRQEDDNLYKIPRSLKVSHRLSQSLDDFDIDDFARNLRSSAHSSIEHISCSQNLSPGDVERGSSENLDYCKVRSGLPITVRRPTLLRKPNKAVDTWNHFKSKVNNVIIEHAAQQRVGAFGDREKISVNLEEMYKNSKTKCKKVLQNAEKIFKRKPGGEYSDVDSGNTTPTVAKNNAFFGKKFKASDIEYKLNISSEHSESKDCFSDDGKDDDANVSTPVEEVREDFSSLRSAFHRRKLFVPEGQNGFEDLRRYVKQGGDFCKELATILQERADAEAAYAKSLSKLGVKLSRACREAGAAGGLSDGWRAVAAELGARADAHRVLGAALLDDAARPLRALTENQHRTRKQCEGGVEKAARSLCEWRAAEAKGKKHSHACARDNEKLQDAAAVDGGKYAKQTLSKSTSLIQLAQMHNKNSTDKENAKLEGKKKKAEDAVKKADIEYYTLCVRAERARLEWESAVLRGVGHFQSIEEERLHNLKSVLTSYLKHSIDLSPRLIEATEGLKAPTREADVAKDLSTFHNLRHTTQQVSEQLLPDFYCEHITLAMNRERRKQALVKLLHLVRQDIERERKSKNGLENLSKAIKQTPNFGTEDSQQTVIEKLYHMKSMLTYLEGARYKVQSALAELDSRPRAGHPLAQHITITRDKSGLQQSVLKVPQWLREEFFETDRSPMSEKSTKSNRSDNSDPHNNDVEDPDWTDRGAGDGNSNQPDSDFDEFSSQCSSAGGTIDHTVAENPVVVRPVARCRAIYPYNPNLPDELALRTGDVLSVYRRQDDGWWLGECGGNVGIFPATYVELMPS